MLLLIKPMVYHGANHELTVKVSLYLLATYLLFDTVLFVAIGGVHYCHKHSLYRAVALFNMTVDKDLIETTESSPYTGLAFLACLLTMCLLEIAINCITSYKKGKRYITRKRLELRYWRQRLREIELENILRSSRINQEPGNGESDTPVSNSNSPTPYIIPIPSQPPPVVVASNPDNSRDASNRNYLLIVIMIYILQTFVRNQIRRGGDNLGKPFKLPNKNF